MRARIFSAFLIFAAAALVSNLLFERLVREDFDDLLRGVGEDEVFLITAAAEGAFVDGAWDEDALRVAVPWALMLGYEIRVVDRDGRERISTRGWLNTIDLWKERRLTGIGALPIRGEGEFAEMPLFLQGEHIGTLSLREGGDPFSRNLREATFRRRGAGFLWISLGIATAGTILFALVLVFSLQGPLRRFVQAADRVRSGDLSVIVPSGGGGELERLRLAFNEMVETLARQEERRTRLVTEVAHELRTPLTILRGTVEGMEDGVVAVDEHGLLALRDEIRRLERLVGGIEELGRAESGRFFLKKEPQSLDEIVRDTVHWFQPFFDERGLTLDLDLVPLSADVDAERVRQLVTNLISNALRHTSKGGVRIRLGKGEDDPNKGKKGRAILEVQDTGSGITDEDRQHIFDRFYRGRSVTAEERAGSPGSGLGLGLAIVKEIAEAHGGRVEVESIVGRGSLFRVILPLRA